MEPESQFGRFVRGARNAPGAEVAFAVVFSAASLVVLYFAIPELIHRLYQAFQ